MDLPCRCRRRVVPARRSPRRRTSPAARRRRHRHAGATPPRRRRRLRPPLRWRSRRRTKYAGIAARSPRRSGRCHRRKTHKAVRPFDVWTAFKEAFSKNLQAITAIHTHTRTRTLLGLHKFNDNEVRKGGTIWRRVPLTLSECVCACRCVAATVLWFHSWCER